MQVVLVMFRAEGDKRSFSVTRDVTVIGRREDCDLRVPVSEVSRKHCRIIRDGDSIRAEDLGSSNGTFHNGQRISGSVALEPGDSIQVGPAVFVLQIDGQPPEDELAPFTERAAHQLDDELSEHPPAEAAHNPEEAAENLEILEETPPPEFELSMPEPEAAAEELELSPLAEESDAIPLAGDSEPLSMDFTEEHAEAEPAHEPVPEGHEPSEQGHGGEHSDELSEDFLLDLNPVEESHEKH